MGVVTVGMATAAKNSALNQSNSKRKHTIHRDRGTVTVRDAEPKVIARARAASL